MSYVVSNKIEIQNLKTFLIPKDAFQSCPSALISFDKRRRIIFIQLAKGWAQNVLNNSNVAKHLHIKDII